MVLLISRIKPHWRVIITLYWSFSSGLDEKHQLWKVSGAVRKIHVIKTTTLFTVTRTEMINSSSKMLSRSQAVRLLILTLETKKAPRVLKRDRSSGEKVSRGRKMRPSHREWLLQILHQRIERDDLWERLRKMWPTMPFVESWRRIKIAKILDLIVSGGLKIGNWAKNQQHKVFLSVISWCSIIITKNLSKTLKYIFKSYFLFQVCTISCSIRLNVN